MTDFLGLGIVGASGIASRRVIPALRENTSFEVAAICSRSIAQAEALAKPHPGAKAYTDYSELLKDEGVDAIYVASPVHCHLEHASDAIRAGKALLCEKPLGRNLEEAKAIASLAEKEGIIAMEAYMMNFHPAHQLLRKELAAGEYGQIISARARFACWYPEIAGSWRQDASLSGGGALMDLGSHLLSLCLYLFGPIRQIHAVCKNRAFHYPVEDDAALLCEMESGARIFLECSFCMPDNTPSVIEICGTKGWVALENTLGQNGGGKRRKMLSGQAEYDPLQQSPNGSDEDTEHLIPVNLYAAQLREFAAAIWEHRQPKLNTFPQGVEIMHWISEAYAQARSSLTYRR